MKTRRIDVEQPAARRARGAGRTRRHATRRTLERSLEELALLAGTAGAEVVPTDRAAARHRSTPRRSSARASSTEVKADGERARRRRRRSSTTTSRPPQVRNLEKALGGQGGGPLRADPRHLRAPRAHARVAAPGRAGAARVHAAAAHRHVEAPRAPGGRHRHARPGRDPARDRPPARARAHRAAQARAGGRRARARDAAPAPARASSAPRSSGYTNAGKSTLFNALTRADVFVEDRLFATLDATTRQMVSPNRQRGAAHRHRRLHPQAAPPPGRLVPQHAQSRRSRPICCCTWWTPPTRLPARR